MLRFLCHRKHLVCVPAASTLLETSFCLSFCPPSCICYLFPSCFIPLHWFSFSVYLFPFYFSSLIFITLNTFLHNLLLSISLFHFLILPSALLWHVIHLNVSKNNNTFCFISFPLLSFPCCLLFVLSPFLISSQGHRDNTNVTFVNCVPYPLSNQMHPKIHSVMIFLVYFLIPLAIISVYYYHIARTLIKSAHDMPGEVSEHTKRQVTAGWWVDEWMSVTLCHGEFLWTTKKT